MYLSSLLSCVWYFLVFWSISLNYGVLGLNFDGLVFFCESLNARSKFTNLLFFCLLVRLYGTVEL